MKQKQKNKLLKHLKNKTFYISCFITFIFSSCLVYAQVNKGILGYDGDSDAGYIRLRGNDDNTIVYIGSVGDNGNDRDRGRLQLREADNNGSETRALLYLPSGRGQLQLDDPSNDLRVRLSSSLRNYGPSSNRSYGYLDLMAGSGDGETISWLGASNDDPLRGKLTLNNVSGSTSESRATLYLPSGRGQLQLDDPSNDLRVRLSSSLRNYGASSNTSYGYLDLLAGTSDGDSIAWLGASNDDPLRGKLALNNVSGSTSQSRATLFLPSGRGQLQLDDTSNDLRVRLSSSLRDKGASSNQSYGYLDLMSGSNNDGDSIIWLGASDSSPERGKLLLYDTNSGSSETRATLHLPSGRGQLQLDDINNNNRVWLSSSLMDKGAANNQSYGYLNLTSGTASGTSIVWLGALDNTPERGRLELRHSDDGKGRVEAFAGSDKRGVLQIKDENGTINHVELEGTSTGGEVQIRGTSGAQTVLLNSETSGSDECGALLLENTGGGGLSFNACTGEKNAIYAHPSNKNKEIFYNALEGPEIGLYTRGKVRLNRGRATVNLPEHFSVIVSEQGLTAQLTPHDAMSKGLAIAGLTTSKLNIVELGGGTEQSNYEVSFLVQGVRKGKEDYKAVRSTITGKHIKSPTTKEPVLKEIDIKTPVKKLKLERVKPVNEAKPLREPRLKEVKPLREPRLNTIDKEIKLTPSINKTKRSS